jgi:putative membrane protein
MKLEKFFDEKARARVAEAVKAAEARTSGQIVPVVVARSRDYQPFRRAFASSFLATLFVLGLGVFVPSLHLTLLNGFAFATVLGSTFFGLIVFFGPLRPEVEAAVRQRAMVAFVEHGVHRTHDENGVLLFASLYERKVVVLGDRAVHEKLGDEHWQRAVATLVAGMRAGDPAGGFCKAIADIGDEMAKAFPRGSSPQSNEISDELRVDR